MSLPNLLCILLQLSSYMQAKTLSCISESCWQTPSRVSRLFSGKYEGRDLKYANHWIQDKWMLESLGPTTLICTESLKWQRYRAFKYHSFLAKSALKQRQPLSVSCNNEYTVYATRHFDVITSMSFTLLSEAGTLIPISRWLIQMTLTYILI